MLTILRENKQNKMNEMKMLHIFPDINNFEHYS